MRFLLLLSLHTSRKNRNFLYSQIQDSLYIILFLLRRKTLFSKLKANLKMSKHNIQVKIKQWAKYQKQYILLKLKGLRILQYKYFSIIVNKIQEKLVNSPYLVSSTIFIQCTSVHNWQTITGMLQQKSIKELVVILKVSPLLTHLNNRKVVFVKIQALLLYKHILMSN